MSFSLADAAPLERTPLRFSALLATLGADRTPADAGCPAAWPFADMPATRCLIAVVLGQPGWPVAARAIANRFAVVPAATSGKA